MMRRTTFKKLMREDTGVTLVELLAAIAILSIVVTAFLAFFIQAANTNNMTDEVNKATFLAQEEMERVTSYSTGDYSGEEVITTFFNGSTERQETTPDGYTVKTKLTEPKEGEALYKVIVEVTGGGKDRAKMETRLPFEKEVND